MATHSSILAWRIPWTEEPGRLQATGSHESETTENKKLVEKCKASRVRVTKKIKKKINLSNGCFQMFT